MYNTEYLVVGAGFAGTVMARELAEAGRQVLVVDRRGHVAGNAYDEPDEHGVLVHRYGPHIFHTNAERVFAFLSRFTAWRPYEHRVLAVVDGGTYPIPINRTTLNRLYGLDLRTDADAAAHYEAVREPREAVRTSEDVVLNTVGPDLYAKFFRGYTRKQWGLDPSQLNASVTARIPVRTNTDDRYFTDTYQAMPADGYTRMFERMLDHPNIEVRLGTPFDPAAPACYGHLVYTGPADAYYGCRFGKLPYRSLRFEYEHHHGVAQYQPVGQVNYPNDHAYTRITEFKHLTGQAHAGTTIAREYPTDEGEPYYPVPRPENQALYARYAELAGREERVTFVGRLATYRYYNMDQVVASALAAAARHLEAASARVAVPVAA